MEKIGHNPPIYRTSEVPHSRVKVGGPFLLDLQYPRVDLETPGPHKAANSNDLKLPIRERSGVSHQMEKETDLPNYLWMGYDSFWGVESCYAEIIPT